MQGQSLNWSKATHLFHLKIWRWCWQYGCQLLCLCDGHIFPALIRLTPPSQCIYHRPNRCTLQLLPIWTIPPKMPGNENTTDLLSNPLIHLVFVLFWTTPVGYHSKGMMQYVLLSIQRVAVSSQGQAWAEYKLLSFLPLVGCDQTLCVFAVFFWRV